MHPQDNHQGIWEERWHPLREEWVLVAAHRQGRPWIGQTVDAQAERVPAYLWYHWHMRRVWVLFGGSL